MKHQDIRDSEIIDRYVLGQLEKDDEQRFEEHFLDCDECQERLNQAYLFRESIKKVVGKGFFNASKRPGNQKTAKPTARRWIIAAAAIFMLSVVISLVQNTAWRKRLSEKDAVIESISANLAKLNAPRVNQPHLFMETQRGDFDQNRPPANIAMLSSKDAWLNLSLNGAFQGFADFRLRLLNDSGEMLWEQSGLKPNADGQFSLSLPKSFLADGKYVLVLEAFSESQFVPFAEYPFQVTFEEDAPQNK